MHLPPPLQHLLDRMHVLPLVPEHILDPVFEDPQLIVDPIGHFDCHLLQPLEDPHIVRLIIVVVIFFSQPLKRIESCHYIRIIFSQDLVCPK